MTTDDDLDRLVGDQLRSDAPGRAPAWLLEATMQRIDGTPQRARRSFLGSGTGRLLAVAAVVLIAVVAGTQLPGLLDGPSRSGASPSPIPSVTDAPRPTPTTVPPSPTAAPSPSPSAESLNGLVLRVVDGGGGPTSPGDLLPVVTIMDDGTVIWSPIPPPTEVPSLLVRRLTPQGLATLRERIFAGGLLDEEAAHELERRPDAPEPPGRGVVVHLFTTGVSGELVSVSSVEWLGDEEEETYYEPAPERRELHELARILRDPESLVDADAWVGPAEPYESASDYQLVLMPARDSPPYGNIDVSEVPLGFDGPLDEYGEPVGPDMPPPARCGVVSAERAAAIVEAIDASGDFGDIGLDMASAASLDWAEGNGVVDLFLMPRMPDGYPECGEV